ncbi:MAG: J domain-containing protein, partial [bacterium]|nr:J domain-containing protein [bacterium]
MTSPAEPTLYELLGVGQDASGEEIRAAYRRLMRAAHPDTGGTAGLFRAVQLAYDTLIDPDSRAGYDAHLRAGGRSFGGAAAPRPRPSEGSAGGAGSHGAGSGRGAGGGESSSTAGETSGAGSGSAPRTGRPTGHSSLYRPMERPLRAEAAHVGAIFDPPLFPEEDSRGSRRRRGSGPISFGRNRGPREPRAATEILPMQVLRSRVVGTPGVSVDAAHLGPRAAELEREATRRTDELLDAALLPAFPAMRLVHDLRDPGTRAATIDHAVVVGDRVVLIDSVMVEAGGFEWDGATLSGGSGVVRLTLPRVIEQARLWLDPWRVSGVTVLHSVGGLLSEPSVGRVAAGGAVSGAARAGVAGGAGAG